MFISSNLVPISRHKFDKRRVLTWGALFRIGDNINIMVTASKTFQFNEPTLEVPLAPADDPMFCPVKALSDMATMVGINKITADTLVFVLPTASGRWTPLQKSDFEKWVNFHLEALHGLLQRTCSQEAEHLQECQPELELRSQLLLLAPPLPSSFL